MTSYVSLYCLFNVCFKYIIFTLFISTHLLFFFFLHFLKTDGLIRSSAIDNSDSNNPLFLSAVSEWQWVRPDFSNVVKKSVWLCLTVWQRNQWGRRQRPVWKLWLNKTMKSSTVRKSSHLLPLMWNLSV